MSDNDSSDAELESVDDGSSEVEVSDDEAEMSDEDSNDAVESSGTEVKMSDGKNKKAKAKPSSTAVSRLFHMYTHCGLVCLHASYSPAVLLYTK